MYYIGTRIEISIMTETGKTFTLTVESCDRIDCLKEKIYSAEGILSTDQRLIYLEKELEDDFKLYLQ